MIRFLHQLVWIATRYGPFSYSWSKPFDNASAWPARAQSARRGATPSRARCTRVQNQYKTPMQKLAPRGQGPCLARSGGRRRRRSGLEAPPTPSYRLGQGLQTTQTLPSVVLQYRVPYSLYQEHQCFVHDRAHRKRLIDIAIYSSLSSSRATRSTTGRVRLWIRIGALPF